MTTEITFPIVDNNIEFTISTGTISFDITPPVIAFAISGAVVITGSGTGASAFTDLTDVPTTYFGQKGKIVAVKSDELHLEFISSAPGGVTKVFGRTGDVAATQDDYSHTLLSGKNGEADFQHLKAAQVSALHASGSDNQDLSPYLKKDGTVPLTGDWTIGPTGKIKDGEIKDVAITGDTTLALTPSGAVPPALGWLGTMSVKTTEFPIMTANDLKSGITSYGGMPYWAVSSQQNTDICMLISPFFGKKLDIDFNLAKHNEPVCQKLVGLYGGRWLIDTVYNVGDYVWTVGLNIVVCSAKSGTGTSGATEPSWNTFIFDDTIDNPGANQLTWKTVDSIYPTYSSSVSQSVYDPNEDGLVYDVPLIQKWRSIIIPTPTIPFCRMIHQMTHTGLGFGQGSCDTHIYGASYILGITSLFNTITYGGVIFDFTTTFPKINTGSATDYYFMGIGGGNSPASGTNFLMVGVQGNIGSGQTIVVRAKSTGSIYENYDTGIAVDGLTHNIKILVFDTAATNPFFEIWLDGYVIAYSYMGDLQAHPNFKIKKLTATQFRPVITCCRGTDNPTPPANRSGTITGTDTNSYLTDSTKAWTVNQWVGYILHNITTNEYTTILSNTANTIYTQVWFTAFANGQSYKIIPVNDIQRIAVYAADYHWRGNTALTNTERGIQ